MAVIHNNENISNNKQFINSTDPLWIEFNEMKFENDQNSISIERTDNATLSNLPQSMVCEITHCIFGNSNETTDFNVIYVENIQPTDRMIVESTQFTSHSVVEIISGEGNTTDKLQLAINKLISAFGVVVPVRFTVVLFGHYTSHAVLYICDHDSYSGNYNDSIEELMEQLCIIIETDISVISHHDDDSFDLDTFETPEELYEAIFESLPDNRRGEYHECISKGGLMALQYMNFYLVMTVKHYY